MLISCAWSLCILHTQLLVPTFSYTGTSAPVFLATQRDYSRIKVLSLYKIKHISLKTWMVFLEMILYTQNTPIPHLTICHVLSWFSRVWLFVTLWTVAHQALLSMGFSRQEYWSGLSFVSIPRDWTRVSCIADRPFTLWTTREVQILRLDLVYFSV